MLDDARHSDLLSHCNGVRLDLGQLIIECVQSIESLGSPQVLVDQLQHGAARRLDTISRALANIFRLFPPGTSLGIHRDAIADATINLHAFLINMAGVADNWAWAYVLRHGLTLKLKPTQVGLFVEKTQARLPAQLVAYLAQPRLQDWHRQYAKEFRDALAHRVPPYIPMGVDSADIPAVERLLEESRAHPRDADRFVAAIAARTAVQKPLPCFIHSLGGAHGQSPLMHLHGQLVNDAMLLVEMGREFLRHWATPPRP